METYALSSANWLVWGREAPEYIYYSLMAALPFKHIIKLADDSTINYLMRNKVVDLAIRC